MAGYTSDEIQAAVEQFLSQLVQVSRLRTGNRDTVAARDQVYDLVTTTFLLRPDSYFYLIWLSANRLAALVAQQLSSLDNIDMWGPDANRPSQKIKSVSDLTSARAALLNVSAGLNSRSGQGVGGSLGPSIDRFRANVERFMVNQLAPNVISGGEVVETGEELRALILAEAQTIVDREAQIDALVANMSAALGSFSSLRLPETTIATIVSRINTRLSELETLLSGSTAAANNRSALLDLIAMRTLLARASNFRAPTLVLAPLTGDGSTVSLIDSDGDRASITGSVSGPFNYDAGTTLDLSLNGGASTPSIALPSSSNAEIRTTATLVFPGPDPAEVALDVDHGTTASYSTVGPWADGPTAAALLDAGLDPYVAVSWDASTSALVFRSESYGDESNLRFLGGTADRDTFLAWGFDSLILEEQGAPVASSDVTTAIHAASPLVEATISEIVYVSFIGISQAGDLSYIYNIIDSGSDLASSGTTVTSPSKNFAGLGIEAGMKLAVAAPVVGEFTILSVDGATLTIDSDPGAGPLTYYIGPDYSAIPAGSRVRIVGGDDRENSGYARVAAGGSIRIQVSPPVRSEDSTLRTTIFQQLLTLSALGTTTSSGIAASASTGATALGFTPAAEVPATLTRVQLAGAGDLLARGVREGDTLTLTSPALVDTGHTIIAVTSSTIDFSPAITYEAGTWSYSISSARYASYVALQTVLESYESSDRYGDGIVAFDQLLGRLGRGAKYTGTEIETAVDDYRTDLQALQTALAAYSVPKEHTIDGVLATMREQGFDRAVELLLTLEIVEFFTMDQDGVSYKSNVVRKLADTTRSVAPVSKFAKSEVAVVEFDPHSFRPEAFDPRKEF